MPNFFTDTAQIGSADDSGDEKRSRGSAVFSRLIRVKSSGLSEKPFSIWVHGVYFMLDALIYGAPRIGARFA